MGSDPSGVAHQAPNDTERKAIRTHFFALSWMLTVLWQLVIYVVRLDQFFQVAYRLSWNQIVLWEHSRTC